MFPLFPVYVVFAQGFLTQFLVSKYPSSENKKYASNQSCMYEKKNPVKKHKCYNTPYVSNKTYVPQN